MRKHLLISLIIIMISLIYSQNKELTLADLYLNRTFKTASLGEWVWLPEAPNELLFVINKIGNTDFNIYKYDIASGDTTVFLSEATLQYDEQAIETDDFWISDDQLKILIRTDTKRIWRHSRLGLYYTVKLSNNEIHRIAGGEYIKNVKFSPDSEKIAYVKSDNNLYMLELASDRERKLTKDGSKNILNGHFGWVYEEEFGSYDAYSWSPDSKSIAFWREDQSQVKRYTLIDEMQLYPTTQQIYYPKVGETNPKVSIGVVNLSNGKKKWFKETSETDLYYPLIKWIDRGKYSNQLIVYKLNRRQNHLELMRFNPKSGVVELLLEEKSAGWLQMRNDLYFFEDGSFVRTSERSGYNHIYHFDKDGILLNAVTSGEWEVSNLTTIDRKSRQVFFTGKHESVIESHFYTINLNGSGFKRLSEQPGWHRINMNPDASIYIDSYSNAQRPLAISGFDSSGEMLREISVTDISQYLDYDWAYPEYFQIETSDNGTKLNAMITYPHNFNPGKKYPVIIYGYSGPASQAVGNYWDRRGWHQFMSQQGYIIFSVDHRGTGGRGAAFKYLAYKDIGKWMVNDQIEGVKYLKSLPFVDENRIGIWGWSGGGYLTAMCMTKGAPHFKVGIAVAPVTDFRWYDTIWTERYMGLLSGNEAGYESASAITYLDQLEGKLLLIHGTGDDNVHSQNSLRMIQEAVTAGKQIDMLFYPNKNHGIRGPKTTYHLYSKMTNYMLENL